MNFLTNLTNKNSLDISHKHRVLSEFTEPNKDEERVILHNIVSSENYCTREYWKIIVSCGRKLL